MGNIGPVLFQNLETGVFKAPFAIQTIREEKFLDIFALWVSMILIGKLLLHIFITFPFQ